MNWPTPFQRPAVRYATLAGASALLLTLLLAPGPLEGSYRGLAEPCLCDSLNFVHFRDGKMLKYASEHPPAELVGRYEEAPDGEIYIYALASNPDEAGELLYRAKPRLFYTQFFDAAGRFSGWHPKQLGSPTTSRTLANHSIVATRTDPSGTLITTHYDPQTLEATREDLRPPRNKPAP
jgi:hypothetical protein